MYYVSLRLIHSVKILEMEMVNYYRLAILNSKNVNNVSRLSIYGR